MWFEGPWVLWGLLLRCHTGIHGPRSVIKEGQSIIFGRQPNMLNMLLSHWGKFKTYGRAGGIFFFVRGKKNLGLLLAFVFCGRQTTNTFRLLFYGVIQSPSFVQESKTKQNKLSTSANFKNNKTYHAPLICHFSAAKCA